jgi:hypothetical protein
MMVYFVAAFLLLSVFHFLYQSTLAPSLRLGLRFRLFALRDRTRELKIKNGELLSDNHFRCLQDSINGLICVLDRIGIVALTCIDRELKRDIELRKRAEARARTLDDCTLPEMRTIRDETMDIAASAVAVNNGAWFIYLLPLLVAYACVSKVKGLLRQLLCLSESDIRRAVPAISIADSSV